MVLAQIAGVSPERIALLAVGFVVLRVLHGIFYIANAHALRSAAWFGAFACVLGLLAQAALRAGNVLAS